MEEKKRLTGEEQRALMKEQYKADLRARKEFLQKVDELKRQQPVLKALESMNVEDDTDEWIQKLNEKSAISEAKMEMALDSGGYNTPAAEEVTIAMSDAEIKKLQAAELVAKMKAEMSGSISSAPSTSNASNPVDVNAPVSEDERPSRKMLDGLT